MDKAGRVADFIELGELMCIDALHRAESCGGHFREEHQTEEGEALRHDAEFMYVAAWEFKPGDEWQLHKEPLKYEEVKPTQRSYKIKKYLKLSMEHYTMNLTLKVWRQKKKWKEDLKPTRFRIYPRNVFSGNV